MQAYDPAAMEQAAGVLPEVSYRSDAYSAADAADALVLLTEWNQFRNLDLARLKTQMRRPVLLDLRNVCEPELVEAFGFHYEGVGRGRGLAVRGLAPMSRGLDSAAAHDNGVSIAGAPRVDPRSPESPETPAATC